MRRWTPILIAALLLVPIPVQSVLAQDGTAQSITIDTLFTQLADAPDEATARSIADQIWRRWTQPDDPVLAERVKVVITGGGMAGPLAQRDEIEALVRDYPDYPEGWNLRATVNFLRGDYDGALADIETTLRHEPRHFGAMAGRVLILHTQGKLDEARAALLEALEVHPYLPERSLFPELGPAPIRS